MLHALSATLFAKSAGVIAGLMSAGALFLLLGGTGSADVVVENSPVVRHATVRQAMDHLDALRRLTGRIGGTDDSLLDSPLKSARSALGADMIALRELAAPGPEETALRNTLSVLALYQSAWLEARDRTRLHADPGNALAAAGPLGHQAAGSLASLGHIMDDGNVTASQQQAVAQRATELWNAGLALFAAGLLLFATASRYGTRRLAPARIRKPLR